MSSREFNESHIPLAYLITFRCYGTWLHGDERGSVDHENNIYGEPFLSTDSSREQEEFRRLKTPPVTLDAGQRAIIETTIREVCTHRNWALHAINVRTNHVHVVVRAAPKPEKILTDFKIWTTRRMRENKLWEHETTPWAAHGSRRYLWTEKNVEAAIDYVLNQQGDDLPEI